VRAEGLSVYEGFFWCRIDEELRNREVFVARELHPAGGVPPDVAPTLPPGSASLLGSFRRAASIGGMRGIAKVRRGRMLNQARRRARTPDKINATSSVSLSIMRSISTGPMR
jgi:hypothetical protein